jgi:4-hydroxy-tetrahydrodipicolinate synthase
MVTPFHEDGGLDDAGARGLARYLVEHGSHGLVLAGTTGEAPTLSDDEKLALFRAVRDELGNEATLIVGTGSNNTLHTVELTKLAAEAGADAALIVTPYYNKPNRAGLIAHYEAVSQVGIPIILYNIPSRTALNVAPDLLEELGRLANVVAVKQANDDELGPIQGLDVLAGNDGVFCRTIEFGGAGGILVSSHLAGPQMREIWDAGQEGDIERAREIDAELQPVYEATAVAGPAPIAVKAVLKMLGVIESDAVRLPLVAASEEERTAIRPALEAAGILAAAG